MVDRPQSEPLQAHLKQLQQVMNDAVPFHRLLGLQVTELDRGHATLELPFRTELIGDAERPSLHGGVISVLADSCAGTAVWTCIGPQDRCSTIDLRVDYLRPGKSEDLRAEGEVLRVGNRVGVANVRVFHPSEPNVLVAEAKGVYSIRREP